jgi:hypothetical protein
MNRFFGLIVRSTDSRWRMYPLGLFFGLDFDTSKSRFPTQTHKFPGGIHLAEVC